MRRFHLRANKWIWLCLGALFFVVGFIGYEQNEYHNMLLSSPGHPNHTKQAVFEPVLPNHPVRLPEDFASRPEFQQEWWRFYAWLEDESGNTFSVQWNFLRLAQDERDTMGWQTPQLYFSSVVINGKKMALRDQKIARGGIGQAGSSDQPFRMWIDNWTWRSLGMGPLPGNLHISADHFALNLQLRALGPYVLSGDRGYQIRQDLLSLASYQFQQPYIAVHGLFAPNINQPALRVSGRAWLSKEWGSELVATEQTGTDHFVIPLDEQRWLSVNRFRHDGVPDYFYGMLYDRKGKNIVLSNSDIQLESLSSSQLSNGKRIPLRWRLIIPKQQIDVSIEPLDRDAWQAFLIPYWEGRIKILGSHNETGFMQLSGY
ncbi:lipocalin-like domain-containing protein [Vibrio metoecus]|uniref:lipocalin-like domain-containing protein n=1 Tax=Vibrio metoecus TaxID=1481663 RepID=UPI000BA9D0F6|nr:lipocalin-like domain-containing protein [Vibrio metoecus]PAR33653.1 hydroxyneurosporene synthase [Vibrio metoecus]